MVDGFPYKEEVGGSSPSVPTIIKSRTSADAAAPDGWIRDFKDLKIENRFCGVVVQLVRTPACHVGGRGFESRRLRHLKNERHFGGAHFVCAQRSYPPRSVTHRACLSQERFARGVHLDEKE